MGGSSWSADVYEDRARARAATNAPVFQHHENVRSGKVDALHEALDPKKMKNRVREARDSAEHPNSVPIIFALDETGSMSEVPKIVQSKLGQLMTTILTKGILTDPQILFCAFGDANTRGGFSGFVEKAPFQVGQFESGLEMEDDLTRVYLEAHGGGQNMESYDLPLYFAVYHTVTDAWEKRQRKGYLFITGDEHAYPVLEASTIQRIFGGEAPSKDYTIQELVASAQERYHVFFLIPGGSQNASSSDLYNHWVGLLGADHVIRLQDPTHVCDVVAMTIGVTEGTATAGSVTEAASPDVKAALDPIAASLQAKVDKAKALGKKTARL